MKRLVLIGLMVSMCLSMSMFGSKIDASVNAKADVNKSSVSTQTDTENAKNWCLYMMPLSDSVNREFFYQALVDLNHGNIRYSIETPSGLHIDVLRAFAVAWVEHNKK